MGGIGAYGNMFILHLIIETGGVLRTPVVQVGNSYFRLTMSGGEVKGIDTPHP